MKTIQINIPKYNASKGFKYNWEIGFEIETKINNNQILIKSNKEGLLSLANHLMSLAQDEVPSSCHLHFDENNSLEEGSIDLIFEKK